MNKLIAILLLSTLSALCADVKLDAPAPSNEYYKAGEFNFDAYAATRTPDFNEHRNGVGFGAGYFITTHSGIRLSTFTSSMRGRSVLDVATAEYVYRIPIGKSAPYGAVGSTFDFERRIWGGTLAVGLEHRLVQHLGLFAEARLVKDWDTHSNPVGEGRAGIRLSF